MRRVVSAPLGVSTPAIRIIPRLDIKGPNLVKGIHLEGLRVLGAPEDFARHYYEEGADELLYVDVVASLYGRNSLLPIIERTAREIFIPLTVAGGIRTIEDMCMVLRAGADKIALNTAALKDPELIRVASKKFGSSTIVVSLEVIRSPDGRYLCSTDNGREYTGVEAVAWACRAAELGAGELLVTSIDREGTGVGYDVELTERIARVVPIPVIACGGAGSVADVEAVIRDGHADAIAIASVLHYAAVERVAGSAVAAEGNREYLRSGRRGFAAINACRLSDLKEQLHSRGVPLRSAPSYAEDSPVRTVAKQGPAPYVAIVDYGMGNLFSVQRACAQAGLRTEVTSDRQRVLEADGVILPGVGAFADAMATLRLLDLVRPIQDVVAAGVPFFGICLGMQLLMSSSEEFGHSAGLDIVPGTVSYLRNPMDGRGRVLKVPEVGWNTIAVTQRATRGASSMFTDVAPDAWMYFVHSLYVAPHDASVVTSTTQYGDRTYCASLECANVFACQFHPERSGREGLQLYRNFAARVLHTQAVA